MGIVIQAQIENISTRKDRTIKLTLGTNEMSPKNSSELFTMNNNLVNVYISANQISDDMMKEVDSSSIDMLETIKSPSQRLRAVLFLNWKQNNQQYDDFEFFYRNRIEKFITQLKARLD